MKRIISIFLCLAVSISLLTPMATATSAGLHNFKDTGTYRKGQFVDVVSGAWYEKNVEQAYNLDLMTGNSAYTFNPTGNITQVEALVITARMHKIYATGNDDFSDIKREMHSMRPRILEWCNNNENNPAYKEFYSAWYAPYAYYLYSRVWPEGRGEYPQFPALAFDSEYAPFIDTKTPITRARFVSYLIGALPESEFKQENNIPDGSIPDVEYDPDIYLLYRAGVLLGSDASGKFNPSSYITRAEVAAIIARMVEPSLRVNKAALNNNNSGLTDKENQNSNNEKFKIYGTYIKVNSADGVSVYVQWENLSEKEIKYISFNVELYNRVNDLLSCDITGETSQWIRQTGPIPNGKGMYNTISYSMSSGADRPFQPDVSYEEYKNDEQNGWVGQYWDCIWYNSQAYYVKIVGVEIEYMDGTVYKEYNRSYFDKLDIITLNVNDIVHQYTWEYPTNATLLAQNIPYSSDNIYIQTLIVDSVTGAEENEALFTCKLQGYCYEHLVDVTMSVVDELGNRVDDNISSRVSIIGEGEFTSRNFYVSTPIEGTYYLIVEYDY